MTTIELPQADEWSSDEEVLPGQQENSQPSDLQHALLEIKRLKEHLAASQRDLIDYRNLVNKNITNIATGALGDTTIDDLRKEELPPSPPRDDDTHYFESYSDQCMSLCYGGV